MNLVNIFPKRKGFIKAVQGDDNLLVELRKAKLYLVTIYKYDFRAKRFNTLFQHRFTRRDFAEKHYVKVYDEF